MIIDSLGLATIACQQVMTQHIVAVYMTGIHATLVKHLGVTVNSDGHANSNNITPSLGVPA